MSYDGLNQLQLIMKINNEERRVKCEMPDGSRKKFHYSFFIIHFFTIYRSLRSRKILSLENKNKSFSLFILYFAR